MVLALYLIPAFLVVMLLTVVLVRGIRESAETNNVMVLLKIGAILAFVFAGMHYIHPSNYHPFAPNGWSGILTGGVKPGATHDYAAAPANLIEKAQKIEPTTKTQMASRKMFFAPNLSAIQPLIGMKTASDTM